MPERDQQVVIIGGGPAGLTGAYELSKLGIKSVILEADNQVGGISRTANYKGYRFDIGGHRFFSKVPYVNQLWQEILGDELLIRPRLSRIHYRGYFFDYPLKPLNALMGLGPVQSFKICLNLVKTKLFGMKQDDNFENWITNRFGTRLYDIFFKTYTEKVWGISCKEISADWAAQRIKNLSLKQAVRNALLNNGKVNNNNSITTLIEQFYYPRLGPGMMWERCQELVANQGSPTLLGERVERIFHQKGQVESVVSQNISGECTEITGNQFLSSMPLKQFINALDPLPPDSVLKAANSLRYRDYLTVVLIVNRENVFPDNWIYIHTPEVKMGRIQNYKNWSSHMVPDLSKTSLGLEYFLWEKDEQWNWQDEQLMKLGIDECVQLGIIKSSEVEDGTVVRMPKAYPVYDQNNQKILKTLCQYLKTFTNLQPIGRNGLHRYNNQDHSMLTGVYAARNIVGQTYNVWSVNTEKEYHEDVKVEVTIREDRLTPSSAKAPQDKEQESIEDVIEVIFARLDPLSLGTAIGIVSGIGLFLATAILLLKGGEVIGPTLSLLGNYLFGFKVGWKGAFLGMFEAGVMGFILGNLTASLRNLGMSAYIALVHRRAEIKARCKLLEKV